MEFNYNRLRARIMEKYHTQAMFANAFGISKNALSRKLNNKMSFSVDDIFKAVELLDIPKKDIVPYFFDSKV